MSNKPTVRQIGYKLMLCPECGVAVPHHQPKCLFYRCDLSTGEGVYMAQRREDEDAPKRYAAQFRPTMQLRVARRTHYPNAHRGGIFAQDARTYDRTQQLFTHDNGDEQWRDLPIIAL